MNKIFCERLRALRIKNGYSQSKLGELLNVGRITVGRIEKGTSIPRVSLFYKFCNLFNVKANYLIGINELKDN